MKKFILICSLLLLCINSLMSNNYKYKKKNVDEQIEYLLSKMTLEEKIGQMTQAERENVKVDEVKKYFLGSILSGGGSTPAPNSPKAWEGMHDAYQTEALSTDLAIPLIYGIDAVHGHSNVHNATLFPHNIGLGAMGMGALDNPYLEQEISELMRKIGIVTAKETLATGLRWNFGPCVAVSRDERWGRSYESYGEDPELQNLLAAPYVKGLQKNWTANGIEKYWNHGSYKVIACAKHYIGDGGTTWGTGTNNYPIDRGDTVLNEDELRKIHLPGFLKAIEAGVETIMVSYSSWNGEKMHGHKYLITDILKEELDFKGFVVSDWDGINDLDGTYYDQIVKAINAGIDMVMVPSTWKQFIELLTEAVESGDVPESRINDAVKRILKVKFNAGLFNRPYSKFEYSAQNWFEYSFGSEYHREIAREAVRKSCVLLKNENQILPLTKDQKIFVAGKSANDIGNQCGGWSITWQGSSGNITPGTTIFEGIEEMVSEGTGSATLFEPNAENLALNKPVTVTSIENENLGGENAVDGDLSTRWGSAWEEPNSITVDLEESQEINKIVLHWENSHASEYYIQISDDGINWTNLVHIENCDGGLDEHDVNAVARYVRMNGIKKSNQYGFSIYEFEIFKIDTDAFLDEVKKHDVAVVVIGETPYSEGIGDNAELNLADEDINMINQVLEAEKPVVVVLVSGRPLIITDELQKWDAFVAAWLPGTEGNGVSEMLFGEEDFFGKLPVTWPKSIDQVPINIGDEEYDPLFPYGYGLSLYK